MIIDSITNGPLQKLLYLPGPDRLLSINFFLVKQIHHCKYNKINTFPKTTHKNKFTLKCAKNINNYIFNITVLTTCV